MDGFMIKKLKENTIRKSKVKKNDGWNSSIREEWTYDVLADIHDLKYEIDNCIKGAMTGCKTYEELAKYTDKLADGLHELASTIRYTSDDDDDDDDY